MTFYVAAFCPFGFYSFIVFELWMLTTVALMIAIFCKAPLISHDCGGKAG